MKISDFTSQLELRDNASLLECVACGNSHLKLQARGLCSTCYKYHSRAGTLDDFPVTDFMLNPGKYLEWIREYFPELL